MKTITAIALLFVASTVSAQWNGGSTTSASIYREGKIGLNLTSAPIDFLQIGDGGNIRLQQRTNAVGATSDIIFNVYRDADPNLVGARIRFSTVENQGTDYPSLWKAGEIKFNTHWAGGEDTRLIVKANGFVGVGTTTPQTTFQVHDGPFRIAMGTLSTQVAESLGWGYVYTGYNMVRTSAGWLVESDGVHNGGSMMLSDPFGNLRFINAPSGGTETSPRTLSDTDVNNSLTMAINSNGNVGIGTSVPDAKLAVKGTVHAREVRVDLQGALVPDYVFDPDYKLPSLETVKSYIVQHKHLPEIPSAKEMEANGIMLGEMNLQLLKKIEELTLYIIDQQESHKDLQKQVSLMQEELNKLRK